MEIKITTWPDHYPDKCPPDNANQPSGDIFRFTNRTNPKYKDFMSYYELQPNGDWGGKACQSRGISVFTSVEDSIAAAAIVPALKKKHLSKAELPPNSGVIATTPPDNSRNHNTLWPLINAEDLSILFSPVAEEA
jgi:hypothetical protein